MSTYLLVFCLFIWLCTCRIAYLWGHSDAKIEDAEKLLQSMKEELGERR